MNKRKLYAGERAWIFSPDCNGKPAAERSVVRTWNGKQDCPLSGFGTSASDQYIFRSAYVIFMILLACFFSTDSKAQQNTTHLVEEIKALLPYRTADFTIDYQSIPTTLSIKAVKYTGLYNYAKYLKQSFSDETFANFSENCINHIASKKIKPPSDSSIFKDKPGSEPIIFD